ncbi:OmpA family protein [uncultured Thiothrix sp.]|uniref:OmpA family protein n=1 Tax=uncultured Thiothrix sp. TaxID=223185 RepID=UPI0026269471|nr:OmpA family protein [uncultured Thiothrix sp.]
MSEKRSCCCGALPALWWWLLTLLGLPLLFWLMIHSRQLPVETDLTARTTDGLKAASLNDVQVNLDHRGRDAQLTGKVASDAEREQAVKLVQDTDGIRVVDNAIEVVAPVATATAAATVATEPVAAANTLAATPAPAATSAPAATPEPVVAAAPVVVPPVVEPSFALLPQDGKWLLQGTLSSQEEIKQAVASAEQMYGAGKVVNQLTVGTVAPATWLASLSGLKEVLAGLEQSGLKFANGVFTLIGVASSDQAKADAAAKIQQLLGSAQLDNQLTVKLPEVAVTAPAAEPAPAAATTATAAVTPAPAATTTPVTTEPATPVVAPVLTEPAATAAAPAPATPEPSAAPTPPVPVQLTSEQQSCQDRMRGSLNGRQILFETNKATIKAASLGLLNNLAKVANECKAALADKVIRVGGHTDDRGEDAYNQNLSQQRADAVKDYLSKQGVDAGLIQGVGYGETQPIASNDTDAGRAQNRRISFDIIQK